MVSVVNNRTSRYVHGGLTTVESADFIGWWEVYDLPKSDDDIEVEITPLYQSSPWMIAYDYYGIPTYLWVILQYNSIIDPENELVVGKTIRIPTPTRLKTSIMIKNTGGVKPNV